MSDSVDKAKDAVSGATDSVKDSDALKKAEHMAEDKAADGGALGSVADKGDDAIDQVQGTKD